MTTQFGGRGESGWAYSIAHPCVPISSPLTHMVYRKEGGGGILVMDSSNSVCSCLYYSRVPIGVFVWFSASFQVSSRHLNQWCSAKGGLPCFESSAKEAIRVEEAFIEAARKALVQESLSEQYNDFPDQIQLGATESHTQQKEGCGC